MYLQQQTADGLSSLQHRGQTLGDRKTSAAGTLISPLTEPQREVSSSSCATRSTSSSESLQQKRSKHDERTVAAKRTAQPQKRVPHHVAEAGLNADDRPGK
ncbi:uncharacterized protein ABDE67_022050 [Symphorus nematophorus]